MAKPRAKDYFAEDLSGLMEGAGPLDIAEAAQYWFEPVATFVGFSGGFDSLVTTHWAMSNVPNCKVFHVNTGIGIERTRQFVRDTCADYGWPLVEIRAKEDCGQDYDAIVRQYGFPGPGMHFRMFQQLKERAVWKLLRDHKTTRFSNVMLMTGIRKDESVRRSGYKYSLFNFMGNLLWVNPLYYRSRTWFQEYIARHNLQQNPVSETLGMSGECLCGAFAHKGEKDLIRLVCPDTADRIETLEAEVKAAGHDWGWEDAPPKKAAPKTPTDKFMPFCVGCEK